MLVEGGTKLAGRPLAALVEYDGTRYAGFQAQKQGCTIQGELEGGLLAVLGRPVRLVAAGRTDAGVHALGQVVHLRAVWTHALADLRRAWNANLPHDIAVRAVAAVPAEFHARYSARSRLYRYQIYTGEIRSPLQIRYAWHVPEALDIRLMGEAAAMLLGRHDLATFGRAPRGENTVRTVLCSQCWAEDAKVCIEVEADAFLQHMMRRIVATLVALGRGRLTIEGLGEAILARNPARAAGLAPPNGLCLIAVRYDPEVLRWPLPSSELWQKESCLE